jgi:hypothetical protein
MKFEPMGISDILDTAFQLYRKRFRTFVAIALVVCVPSSFAAALLTGAARLFTPPEQPDDEGLLNAFSATLFPGGSSCVALLARGFAQVISDDNPAASLLALTASVVMLVLAGVVVFSIAYPLCTGALVVNISASYLGETVGPAQSYARAFRKLWRVLTAQAWTTILVLLGLMLCLVPGVVLWLQLALAPLVVLLEDRTAWAALGRSRALMADNLGKAFGLAAIVWLLDIVVSAAISTAVHFVPWPLPLIEDFVALLLTQLVVLPLSIATVVLLYYDLRIRKESFELQQLASAMEDFRPR